MAEKNPQSESHLVPVGPLAPGQRWSLARKREVALRLLRGEPIDALSRELGVEVYRLERWKEKALAGLDAGLKEREGDPVQAQLDAALRRIGELSMENELLCVRIERPGPLAGRRSKR
jgi:transposase